MTTVLFRKTEYPVKKLLEDIHAGHLALPDIQRPFTWPDVKVRDLFDSMYRGYPVGTLLLWENGRDDDHRLIGHTGYADAPHLLIIDGQQRLTSLYAVMRRQPVTDQRFVKRHIRIAFHPLSSRFEVSNAAIQRNPEWIADISGLWADGASQWSFIRHFLNRLKDSRPLTAAEEEAIAEAIQRLYTLESYPLIALEVSSSVDEEQVAEIFVRINSQGKPLKQSDFILTLMAVFWDEGREQLDTFCHQARIPVHDAPSPYNPIWTPEPDQLMRVSVALGFRRARLRYAYMLLRGKDLATGVFSTERRQKQFTRLQQAQQATLDLQHWHDFLTVPKLAGFVHKDLIQSKTALLFTYALWLIGRTDLQMPHAELRRLLARWLFMSMLTGRYTNSPETQMEEDLARLRDVSTPSQFTDVLETEMATTLTNDYWSVTLPNDLIARATTSSGFIAYQAALLILDAPALYSDLRVRQLFEPSARARKTPLEKHHLFPRDVLRQWGFEDQQIDQVANLTLVEWPDNITISNKPPCEYAPAIERRFSPERLRLMYELHALPERWYELEYLDFLAERRRRMAALLRQAFDHLQVSS